MNEFRRRSRPSPDVPLESTQNDASFPPEDIYDSDVDSECDFNSDMESEGGANVDSTFKSESSDAETSTPAIIDRESLNSHAHSLTSQNVKDVTSLPEKITASLDLPEIDIPIALTKSIRSVMNKLSESSVIPSITQLLTIRGEYSRHEFTTCFVSQIMNSMVSPAGITVRQPIVSIGLMTCVTSCLDSNVWCSVLEEALHQWDTVRSLFDNLDATNKVPPSTAGGVLSPINAPNDDYDGGSLNACFNLILFTSNLLHFAIITADFVYELLDLMLIGEMVDKDVMMIVWLVQFNGPLLRSSHPERMNNFIVKVQERLSPSITCTNTLSAPKCSKSRIQWMLDALSSWKKKSMWLQYDQIRETTSRLKALTRSHRNHNATLHCLPSELRDASKRGRWWQVGAAWAGKEAPPVTLSTSPPAAPIDTDPDASLMILAKKMKMNTSVRQSVFCALMSSDDYMDAYERIMRLGLNATQQREIIRVCLICCLQVCLDGWSE